MRTLTRRFFSLSFVGLMMFVVTLSASAKTAVPKVGEYKGNGIRIQFPNGWIARDEPAILQAMDKALAQFMSKVKTFVLLYHPSYQDKKTQNSRVSFIVLSDSDTKKNGKVMDVMAYVKTGIEGLPPELAVDGGTIKKIKMAGLPAAQWGFRLSKDSNEFRFTTIIKGGVAYSLYLETEKGLFVKDKKVRDVYAQLQKSFQFVVPKKTKK